ncbi:MAG: hypothetical protein ACLQU1_34290 [Bryobacteraceae bacterium]
MRDTAAVTLLTIGVTGAIWLRPSGPALAQNAAAETPRLTASAKGPDQINLAWPPVRSAGYGYLVEIRSSEDARYRGWTELQPIPKAEGYTCDSSIRIRDGKCNISDPSGMHVYNPGSNGVPYWVTDANYTDPQDDSPAQFIAWGLRPDASYSFRVRTYSGAGPITYGPYSNTATATTAHYGLRYVAPGGNDSNDGSSPAKDHAWRTLGHGARSVGCGQALIVMAGDYGSDAITTQQACSGDKKIVIMANPGDSVTITSMASAGAWHPILLMGNHIVIDGLRCVSTTPVADYDIEISGSYNALLNVEAHPPVIPGGLKGGVIVRGSHNLVYGSALHDYGSPDSVQNPDGNGGFVLTLFGTNATRNVVWSNHLTRGGHDVSLCKSGCSYSRFLNNVMDGGWGMGFEAVGDGAGSDHNLIEGNVIKGVGQLVTAYKPSMEISGGNNTVRRNISIDGKNVGVEVSAFGPNAAHNLIYNNVFYAPGGCIFQSSAGGSAKYDNDLYANNICYKFTGFATDIYSGNKTNTIARNVILGADKDGTLRPEYPTIIWNHSAGAPYEYAKPLAYAESSYNPPFSGNKELELDPKFVNETAFDFHLSTASPVLGAGIAVPDAEWGTAEGVVDLGAFGVHLPKGQGARALHP